MMLQPAYYRANDMIVKEHSPATEMFFLTRGRAAVLQKGRQVFVLEEGSYFGEIGCIIDAVRNASIKAVDEAEVQVPHGVEESPGLPGFSGSYDLFGRQAVAER